MRNKYGNRNVVVDDITFASRKEAKYYLYLKQMEADGEIPGFRMQVPYELIPAGMGGRGETTEDEDEDGAQVPAESGALCGRLRLY